MTGLCAFFPTRDFGSDAAAVRDWAQAAEDLGYDWITVPDHVLGADPASREGWNPPYSHLDQFHETFVTMGYLAACTKRIGLASGVLILPQRQTALVAKQAAEVDILSGGRLRLGIGTGWNFVEYEALNEEWETRGARQAEQVALLRRLWTEELVTTEGRWHGFADAGLNPLPPQRPIPIWFGGTHPAVLRRAAKMGDGWIPIARPDDAGKRLVETLHGLLEAEGRDPASFCIDAWLRASSPDVQKWAAAAEGWRGLGASLLTLYPLYRVESVDERIQALARFKEAAGVC